MDIRPTIFTSPFRKPIYQRLSFGENPKQRHKRIFTKKNGSNWLRSTSKSSSSFGVGLGVLTWLMAKAGINFRF